MQSIVETPSFLADAKEAGMDDAERMAIVLHLAANPLAGDVMAGTGGAGNSASSGLALARAAAIEL